MRPYKIETPYTILEWNRETFGDRPHGVIGARALLEVCEFIHAVAINDPENILDEIADVAITLWLVAALSGVDARPNVEKDTEDHKLVNVSTQIGVNYMHYIDKFNRKNDNTASKYLAKALLHLEMTAGLLGVDLAQAVDNKMTINRNRKWQKLPNGIDQHVA